MPAMPTSSSQDRPAPDDSPTIRVDLHTHTNFSPDATTRPQTLIQKAREANLDRIAVTDHGEIEGAFRAKDVGGDMVIIGEEIRCRKWTEVIGLFLEKRIPEGLPIEETVARIHDQGGIAYAPHPFAYPWGSDWHGTRALEACDIVEGVNGRVFRNNWNDQAQQAAREADMLTGAGSDAHFPFEVGRVFMEMPTFTDVQSFREALKHGRLDTSRRARSPLPMMASTSLKTARQVARTPGPWMQNLNPRRDDQPVVGLKERVLGPMNGPAWLDRL